MTININGSYDKIANDETTITYDADDNGDNYDDDYSDDYEDD